MHVKSMPLLHLFTRPMCFCMFHQIANCIRFTCMHRCEANPRNLEISLDDYEVIPSTFIYLRILKCTFRSQATQATFKRAFRLYPGKASDVSRQKELCRHFQRFSKVLETAIGLFNRQTIQISWSRTSSLFWFLRKDRYVKGTICQKIWLTVNPLRIQWSILKLTCTIIIWILSWRNLTRVSQTMKIFKVVWNFLIRVIFYWLTLHNWKMIGSWKLRSSSADPATSWIKT